MWQLRTLASQILVWVLCILLVTVGLGGFLFVRMNERTLDAEYEQQAVAIANTVAQLPQVISAVQTGKPGGPTETLAQQIVRGTGASYVVIANLAAVRYSHPDPALIGKKLQEGLLVLDGRAHTGINNGNLGRSANGRVPIFDPAHHVIGEVSVGVLESKLAGQRKSAALAIIAYSAGALALGVVASLLLARRIKRLTFGLELPEMASLLHEREAMLYGIREGVVGFGADGKITILNQEAQRLLDRGSEVIGGSVAALTPPGRLHDLLSGRLDGVDEIALTDDYLLVVNRMPVVVGGRSVGSVVTLRDRSELEALLRELRSVNELTSALRAQEHEYANRLHVMAGLLEMGEQEQAASYLAEISRTSIAQADDLRARVAPSALAALLVAKVTIAHEHGIRLEITEESHLAVTDRQARVVQTVLGNLIDNAIEAVSGTDEPREIQVALDDAAGVSISVTDTGPGLRADDLDAAFIDGYTTKAQRGGMRRGLGLALVSRIVRRAGGTITAYPGPGGRFEVRLAELEPDSADAGDAVAGATYVAAEALR